uniref:Uncharacterized protein n=1 Tax=Cannabis sativa TaxID=3483 RepID=A0A803NUL9_CANSA
MSYLIRIALDHWRKAQDNTSLSYIYSSSCGDGELWTNGKQIQLRLMLIFAIFGDNQYGYGMVAESISQVLSLKLKLTCFHGQVDEFKCFGAHFTWSNKHEVRDRIFSKLDRVFTNDKWLISFLKPSLFQMDMFQIIVTVINPLESIRWVSNLCGNHCYKTRYMKSDGFVGTPIRL